MAAVSLAASAGVSVHVGDSQTDIVVGTIKQLITERQGSHRSAVSVLETLLERPDISSFAQELLQAIESCVVVTRSQHLAKERSFTKFHENRLNFPSIWKNYAPNVSNLLSQSVNRHIFEKLLTNRFSETPEENPVIQSGLYAEEENVIRYVSGFVAHKLLQVYKKEHSPRAAPYVECLMSMAVSGPESNFYDYTKMWLRLVDRGALFAVNDNSYLFFRALELKTRSVLPQHLRNPSKTKELLIQDLIDDDDIQFFWSMLSIDITNHDHALHLLQKIAELWLTVRGFSTTGNWMDQYKKHTQKKVTRKKSLRKDLKAKGKRSRAKATATIQEENSNTNTVAVEEDNGSISSDTEQDSGSSVEEQDASASETEEL